MMEELHSRLFDLCLSYKVVNSFLKRGEQVDVMMMVLEESNRQFESLVDEIESVANKRAVLKLVQ